MKVTPIIALFVTLSVGFSFPQSLRAQSVFENPQPDSFQSGVGVISGWVCEAEQIDITFYKDTGGRRGTFFVGTDPCGFNQGCPPEGAISYQAAYGTAREDTKESCGDIDNGFGLLFNWNLLGPGTHLVQARADGEVFGTATVTVTTLGEEFLTGASGHFVVEDFPTADEDIRLRWQQTTQNFVIAAPHTSEQAWGERVQGVRPKHKQQSPPLHTLENPPPGSSQSGVGIISGWVCEAERIDVVFNPGPDNERTFQAGYGTSRADTEGVCNDIDNGFGLLFNWNLLGAGQHTVSARADGVEFGSATVRVTTFDTEFLRDVGKHARLQNFPNTGTDLIVAWQQSLQNFTIARLDNLAPRIASIDAIGDSISKAVNARENTQGSCTNRDQESFNWATSITQDGVFCSDGGDRVYSQAERLECRQETMIVNTDPNSAVSGAEMLKDFFDQAENTKKSLGTKPAPRYVTVEMGHNDICSGTIERIQADCAAGEDQDPMNHCRTTEAAFEREFRKGLDVLITVPDLKIGIAAPVRVSQLCNHATKTNCSLLGGTCESLWRSDLLLSQRDTGLCGSITIDCSDERLQDGYETARAYRDIMDRVSSEYAALPEGETSKEIEVGGEPVGGKVKAAGASLSFSNASWVYKFTSEQISCCDCFHPSFLGQDAAAQILFDGFTCSPTDVCCADTGDPVSDALCTTEDTGGTFHPGLF